MGVGLLVPNSFKSKSSTMKRISFTIIIAAVLFTSCKKEKEIIVEAPGQATLSFDARVNGSDFALNTNYTIGSRTYQFNKLRYWVSNVSLVDTKGTEYKIPNSYFLVEETGPVSVQDGAYTYPANKREDVTLQNIPVGDYKTVKFSIGVDSVFNKNLSLQAGELSQLNGMTNVSWMWHTSYIFSSIGGTVTEGATTKTIKAETGLNTNYKSVSLDLPATVHISSSKAKTIVLVTDVSKLFNGIDLIATPTIGASQATAMSQLATNYTQAISVTSIKE